MDESTFYVAWKTINDLELESLKALDFLQDHLAYEHELNAQINRIFGITRARQALELQCRLMFGKTVKELAHA